MLVSLPPPKFYPLSMEVLDLFGNEIETIAPSARKREKGLFDDYEGFVEKFKPKKTTDDCYTPPEVYNEVMAWVRENCDMEVGYASSGEELFNSLLHEMRHVEEHITKASQIEPYGEPVAYLTGELGRQMYSCIGHYLCDCCRKHLQKN